MSIINVKDEHSTAKYYISLATAPEICSDTAWFIKNKHHILSLCCSTNVIIPVAVHRNIENVITWQENDGVVVWESLLGWLLGCVLCEPQGNKSSFFSSRSTILFHPIPLSWEPRFSMDVTSVASAGPRWPPILQLFIFPVEHTAQYPWFAEARGAAPLWA